MVTPKVCLASWRTHAWRQIDYRANLPYFLRTDPSPRQPITDPRLVLVVFVAVIECSRLWNIPAIHTEGASDAIDPLSLWCVVTMLRNSALERSL